MSRRGWIWAALLAVLAALAAPEARGQALLWEATGPGADKPSFLFGTMHLPDPRLLELEPSLDQALGRTKAFVMEMDIEAARPAEVFAATRMGQGLSELLSPDDWAALDDSLRAWMGIGAGPFENFKPFFVAAQVATRGMAPGGEPLDLHLRRKAEERELPILAFETFAEQMALVDSMGLQTQATLLMQAVRDTSWSLELERMVGLYLAEDLEALAALEADSLAPKDFQRLFVDERNRRMAQRFAEMAAERPVFAAVGAGHLGGDEGILALLRKAGWRLVPISVYP